MDFPGKRVLVTGGSRGIGRAIALAFAEGGAKLAIGYRQNESAALATLAELGRATRAYRVCRSGKHGEGEEGGGGGEAGEGGAAAGAGGDGSGEGHVAIAGDVAAAADVERLVATAVDRLGGLDILVNNAGIGYPHPPAETGYDDWRQAWRRILDTNLIGPANLCHCAAAHMMKNGGRIVNVSSRGAFRGEPTKPAYGASKAGLNALGQSLAVALAPHGITVGTVAPGFVTTDLSAARLAGAEGDGIRAQSPFQRVAEPREVAHAVLFLASEGAEFSTGTIIDVNGASYLR